VVFVGHPLADTIPLYTDSQAARQALGLPAATRVLALLPGSRQGEVARLAPAFLDAARLLAASDPALHFVLPCATVERRAQVEALLHPPVPRLHLLDGQSRMAMAAADAVLLASGTATLEALLLKKPMLVCYRMSPLSYALISRLLKVPYFSLPNLLAGKRLVEELVQEQVKGTLLADKLHALLSPGAHTDLIYAHYDGIHQQLRGNASARAARAVLELL
jgi:lipid-A-disaccharide synthase